MFLYLDQSMSDVEVHPWQGASGGHFWMFPSPILSFVPVIFYSVGKLKEMIIWRKTSKVYCNKLLLISPGESGFLAHYNDHKPKTCSVSESGHY